MTESEAAPVERLLADLRRLAPAIGAQRATIERDRRLPEPLFRDLAECGFFRLLLPQALGGLQLSPLAFMAIVEAAAAIDGTVGWLVGNGGGMSRIGGYLEPAVVTPWFADPHAFVTSATGAVGSASPVAGGYCISGRWPFGSGAHHATRFMGLGRIDGADQSDIKAFYLAREQVSIIDNWHVSGLRGTGSCDFEAREAFVPASHVHDHAKPQPRQPGLLYRMANVSVFSWTVATVPLGIARGAMDCAIGLVSRRVRDGTASAIGQAEARHRAARAFLIAAMTGLMEVTDGDDAAIAEARLVLRLASTHAADVAAEIVAAMARIAGSAAIAETHALERCVRDVQAAVRHIAMSPDNYAAAGRLRLGLEG